jgi:TolA-binding protein
LLRARHIGANLDSTIAAYASDPQLVAAMKREQELTRAVDSLHSVEAGLRRDIAATVAERGRARLVLEREAIDYNIADASYELAVTMATDPSTAEDTTAVAPYRRRAIRRLEMFLTRHPESVARGESRFRLADMRLMQAKDDFQIRMASFIDGAPSADDLENRALAPFVDYAPAISLYRAMLAEDEDFPHMDAVLFNLGMILSDDGQAEATTYLARLVEQYPDSPNCQEAWLRMGSDLFDRKQFGTSLAHFEEAAAGSDPEFTAIALYKLGWAQFEQDDFVQSADAFRRLIDHYNANDDLAEDMDLRDEAEEYLVHSLARSGGASAFSNYFNQLGSRTYESDILMSLGHLMKSLSLYEEAVACDELWLSRYPRHQMALAVAERLVSTYRRWNKPEQARAAKLAQAERFLPGSSWHVANTDAEQRDAALEFAQSAYRENAAHYHRLARKSDDAGEWRSALSNYEQYLTYWPEATDVARIHYLAGESAFRLEGFEMALEHFRAASLAEHTVTAGGDSTAVDSLNLAMDASWQMVAVADAWYRDSSSAGTSVTPSGTNATSTTAGPAATGSDVLARRLIDTGDYFLKRFPADDRSADIAWRQGNVAYAHGWYDEAAVRLYAMSQGYASDKRAGAALRMSGDARYQLQHYDAAGAAYEGALSLAEVARDDSTAAALRPVIPLCYYKHAESVAAADPSNGEMNAAPLFARVAERWPAFEHADRALYRSGLGFAALEQHVDAATAWEQLLANYPDSEYARDSAIQIAIVLEQSGNKKSAANAYERFSRLHTDDPDAPEALLKAVDLLAETNDESGAEDMRSLFLKRFPNDKEAAIAIRETRAVRDLAKVTAGGASLSALLATGTAAGSATDGVAKVAASELKEYLALAEAHPELASPVILAQVDYLKAEEVYPRYKSMRLTQPLPKAIEAKKAKMQELLEMYEACTSRGVAEYSRASAHRIGQVLIDFGDALIASERPADLSEDDLYAYDEVIEEQGWGFYDRGEDVWAELLRQVGDAESDPGEWIARTRQALWPRLGQRFLYQPELEYPLVKATRPVTTQR